MDRRQFLRKGFLYSALGGLYASTIGRLPLFASRLQAHGQGNYDLVAVRRGEPVELYRRAMEEMGGMSRFVRPGQSVIIKPNCSWDVPPERGANTNPELVKAIVEDCLQAGASRVFAFDHTCDNWERSYANSGVADAVRLGGGQMLPANLERYYTDVTIPGAMRLTSAKVYERLMESDVYINVPVLKHHASTTITVAMKNLMGVVWDRRFWHRNDLHQCIADFCLFRKPDLNIVDAYRVMTQNGPRGRSEADISVMRSLLVSTDIVAVDAAGAMMLGHEPEDIGHLRIAAEMGIGSIDLEALNIKRVAL
ncbi:MAG: DUF362 domain-containing protein [Bacteroidales bacterium]|nr:DUF362 domain-containing protein [Bacteroidales bacterium]